MHKCPKCGKKSIDFLDKILLLESRYFKVRCKECHSRVTVSRLWNFLTYIVLFTIVLSIQLSDVKYKELIAGALIILYNLIFAKLLPLVVDNSERINIDGLSQLSNINSHNDNR